MHPIIRDIAEQRVQLGMHRGDLARAAGYDRSVVEGAEQGRRSPRLDTVCDMAEAVGLRLVIVPREPVLDFVAARRACRQPILNFSEVRRLTAERNR